MSLDERPTLRLASNESAESTASYPAPTVCTYDVIIRGRPAGRLVGADPRRRWRLEYGAHEVTLASLGAALAFIKRYADRVDAGKLVDIGAAAGKAAN
jgi:hypothetical protein